VAVSTRSPTWSVPLLPHHAACAALPRAEAHSRCARPQNTQPWVRMAFWAGVELDEFPRLAAWVERIEQRAATQSALKIPEQDKLSQCVYLSLPPHSRCGSPRAPSADLASRGARRIKADPEAAERMAKAASKWIMQGSQDTKEDK